MDRMECFSVGNGIVGNGMAENLWLNKVFIGNKIPQNVYFFSVTFEAPYLISKCIYGEQVRQKF